MAMAIPANGQCFEVPTGEMMKSNYDLTTREGLRSAIKDIRGVPVIGKLYAPYFWLADKALDIFEPGKAVEKQSKAAVDIIKAGKQSGVKKMKITMDEQAGFHFDVPIEDVNINISAGSKGKVTVEVEYS